MTAWMARAKAHFSETGHLPTAKTDKTTLSAVLAAPTGGLSKKSSGVKAVSSVGVVALFENHTLSADLMAAAMHACDKWGDSPAARQQMRLDVLATSKDLRQDLRDHFDQTYGGQP